MSDLTGPVEAAARSAADQSRTEGGEDTSWDDLTSIEAHLSIVAAAIAQYETERADQ